MKKNIFLAMIILLNSIFPFVLLPFYIYVLDPDDYGRLIILDTVYSLLLPIISFGLGGYLVNHHKRKNNNFDQYLATCILLIITMSLVSTIIGVVLYLVLSPSIDVTYAIYLLLPFTIGVASITNINALSYQCEKDSFKFALFLLLPNSLATLTTIILIVFLEYSWHSKIISTLLIYTLFAIASVNDVKSRFNVKIKFYITEIKSNMAFTLPLIPHSLAAGLYFGADKFFIEYFLSSTEVAVYGLGLQLSLVILVLQSSISQLWFPYFSKTLSVNKSEILNSYKQIIKNGCLLIFFVTLSAFSYHYLLNHFAIEYLPNEYISSLEVSSIIIISYTMLFYYKIVSVQIWYADKSNILSRITIFVLCLNLVLNLYFIPLYGIVGAAWATAISTFSQFILSGVVSLSLARKNLVYDFKN